MRRLIRSYTGRICRETLVRMTWLKSCQSNQLKAVSLYDLKNTFFSVIIIIKLMQFANHKWHIYLYKTFIWGGFQADIRCVGCSTHTVNIVNIPIFERMRTPLDVLKWSVLCRCGLFNKIKLTSVM